MRYREALSLLKFRRERSFILAGVEQFQKEQFVLLAEKAYPDHEKVLFDPDRELDAYNILSTASLFSTFFVVLRDFNKMSVAKFEEVIKSFNGILVMILSEKADLKSRALSTIVSHATLVECDSLKEYGTEYPIWIRTQISDAGYECKEDVDNLIYFKVGPSLFSIALELEKLFLMKSDRVIRIEDVEKYVSMTSVGTSYDLFESLLKRDVKSALQFFDIYSKSQDNFSEIVTFIGRYLEKMYRILLLKQENMEVNDIAGIIGIPGFILKKKYLPRISSLGKDFIASKIDGLCRLDAHLRNFRGDKKVLFERFIMNFS